MITIRQLMKRSKEEKEKILLEIQKMGIVAGCRHFGLSKSLYYDWARRYSAFGIDGLEDRRRVDFEAANKKLAKENELLKKLLAEKEMEGRLKDELLKKKIAQWNRGKKS
jgi:putative transposase